MKAILAAAIVAAFGWPTTAGATTASWAELNLGMGARSAGMGDAYVGVSDDAEAIAWNPAGLGEQLGVHLTAMHLSHFTKVNIEQLAASYAQAGLGTFAISL